MEFYVVHDDGESDDKYDLAEQETLTSQSYLTTTATTPDDPLEGTFYFDVFRESYFNGELRIRTNNLGAAHHQNGRPAYVTWGDNNKGAWQRISVVKKSPGVYTLMAFQGPKENRKYFYLNDDNDSVNFNTQDINQSVSLSVLRDNRHFTFRRISDGKYITFYNYDPTIRFSEISAKNHDKIQKWRATPVDIDGNIILVGTFYFYNWNFQYLGADHHENGRPAYVTWGHNKGAWQRISVVEKAPGVYTLMSHQGNGQYYFLNDDNDSVNFNTQDINQSTSLSVSLVDCDEYNTLDCYTFQTKSDNRYIAYVQGRYVQYTSGKYVWRFERV